MKAAHYDFEYEQGADHVIRLQLKPDGNPRDLTGWTAKGAIKLQRSDERIFATIRATITDPTEGKIELFIKGSDTTGYYFKKVEHDDYVKAVYDVIIEETGTEARERVIAGVINISPEVTT